MLSLLIASALPVRPVILVPGTFCSTLQVTNQGHKKFWYCPKDFTNTVLWVNEEYLLDPLYNCMFDMFTATLDAEGNVVDQNGITTNIVDFGGIEGISSLDKPIFGHQLIPYYTKYIEYLKEHGYTVGKTLFGAPWDWRHGLALGDAFWDQLRELAEKAYNINNGAKVVLVGHSLGGHLVHEFLSARTTPEWRAKYIASEVLVAPSFGGSGFAFNSLWTGKIPELELIGNEAVTDFVRSAGGVHVHLLNQEIFGDQVVSIGPNGEKYHARDLPNLLISSGKLSGNNLKIFQYNKNFSISGPVTPDVPTAVIYNDALSNLLGVDMSNDNKKIFGKGDHIVNAEGYHWICDHWKGGKAKLLCYNANSTSEELNHITMVYDTQMVAYTMGLVVDGSWEK